MYKIAYAFNLEKTLKKIPKRDLLLILNRIESLAEDPRGPGTIKLTGREGYRVRAGDYCIIYTVEDEQLLVLVVDIDLRGNIYRK